MQIDNNLTSVTPIEILQAYCKGSDSFNLLNQSENKLLRVITTRFKNCCKNVENLVQLVLQKLPCSHFNLIL